jgi:hypothetical protein
MPGSSGIRGLARGPRGRDAGAAGLHGRHIHKARTPETGAALRIVRYELKDRAALDRYLAEFAPRMRAEALARFGDRFRATRRIVLEGRDAALTDARPCPNCGELLWGQYCASCGQRARVRMITFWELLKDAGDLLASLDSRLWRTLGLLLFRPGRLTLDYLQGRRARFVPPVRLFIASSIVFFFIATLNTRFEFGPERACSWTRPNPAERLRPRRRRGRTAERRRAAAPARIGSASIGGRGLQHRLRRQRPSGWSEDPAVGTGRGDLRAHHRGPWPLFRARDAQQHPRHDVPVPAADGGGS